MAYYAVCDHQQKYEVRSLKWWAYWVPTQSVQEKKGYPYTREPYCRAQLKAADALDQESKSFKSNDHTSSASLKSTATYAFFHLSYLEMSQDVSICLTFPLSETVGTAPGGRAAFVTATPLAWNYPCICSTTATKQTMEITPTSFPSKPYLESLCLSTSTYSCI